MAEGNSRKGIGIGGGGLTGPLTGRERKNLFPNDERVDHSGYPRGFAPVISRAETEDTSTEEDQNLDLGMTLLNNPNNPQKIYAQLARLKRNSPLKK